MRFELSNTSKLSVFESVFVLILTYGHESCVMTERVLSQVQAAQMGFCKESRVWHFATKCAVLKFVKPWMSSHFSESRDSCVGSDVWPEWPRKDWRGKWGPPRTKWRDRISDFPWSRLGVEPEEFIWDCCCPWRNCISNPPGAAAPAILPRQKADMKMNDFRNISQLGVLSFVRKAHDMAHAHPECPLWEGWKKTLATV